MNSVRPLIRNAIGVLGLLTIACGGAGVLTHATEADRQREVNEPLKAVVSYDYALKNDIPKDHPLYAETKAKRRRTVLEYADKEAKDSAQDPTEKRFTRLRTALNTVLDLDDAIDLQEAPVFSAAFNEVLEALAKEALTLDNPGERFRRLEYLAASGPKGNAAKARLDTERVAQLARYDGLIAKSGPAMGYLYSAVARRILPSRALKDRPSTNLALSPLEHKGKCLSDLKNSELRSEGVFPIAYSLKGLSCRPNSKSSVTEASYTYIEQVPKTITQRVKQGETCTPTSVVRTHNVCMTFNTKNSTCAQWGTQTVREAGTPKCQANYVDKEVTIYEKVQRTGNRTENHVEHRYAIDFEVHFEVGSKSVSQTHKVEQVLGDYSYKTKHGSRAITISALSAQQSAWNAVRAKIALAQAEAAIELGNQHFAAASSEEERATATLLGATEGVLWVQNATGLVMEQLPLIAKGEVVTLNLPSDKTELPKLESDIQWESHLGLIYADAWKGGTNIYLTEGGDLRLSNEAPSLGDKGGLALRYERRLGLDDFKFSIFGSLHADSENPSDNLGWGIGQYTLMGDYEAATAFVYTMGMRYEQRKSGGDVSFRTLSLDYYFYYPITRFFSLDAGLELNAAKLFGKSKTIDYGSDVWGGASVYIGRRLAASLRYSKWFASDFDNTITASITLRH